MSSIDDDNDSPAFRLRPRRSTPRTKQQKPCEESLAWKSFVKERLRDHSNKKASSKSKKKSLLTSSSDLDNSDSTVISDSNSLDAKDEQKVPTTYRTVADSIGVNISVSPFLQRINIDDLEANKEYKNRYITLRIDALLGKQAIACNEKIEHDDATNHHHSSDNSESKLNEKNGTSNSASNNNGTDSYSNVTKETLELLCTSPLDTFDNDEVSKKLNHRRDTKTIGENGDGHADLKPKKVTLNLLKSESPVENSTQKSVENKHAIKICVRLSGQYAEESSMMSVGKVFKVGKFVTRSRDISQLRSVNSTVLPFEILIESKLHGNELKDVKSTTTPTKKNVCKPWIPILSIIDSYKQDESHDSIDGCFEISTCQFDPVLKKTRTDNQ